MIKNENKIKSPKEAKKFDDIIDRTNAITF
jgi:hypothetical protein